MYKKSIDLLKKAVADELSAVHQYMYFHFHCDDQGLDLLAGLFRRTAIEEMMHIERLAERILFLKGDVEMKASHATESIQEVKEMLKKAREMEEQSIQDYNNAALACGPDSVTKKLFESLVMDEERHYRQYDDENGNIKRYGDDYLAQQSMERSRNIAQAAAAITPKGGA
ncbi:MAG: bacterioferritin [Magnetococcales bacterium]|nr:manganese catalase family protein [Magnetococcales bacterium]NGZ04795.1 bacterioferritin [Magnetococcales bacterium]